MRVWAPVYAGINVWTLFWALVQYGYFVRGIRVLTPWLEKEAR
jgi:hypothetical protein